MEEKKDSELLTRLSLVKIFAFSMDNVKIK